MVAGGVERLTADALFAVEDGVYAGGPRTLREFAEVTWAYGYGCSLRPRTCG
ncbi:hypothetical protein STANM309S_03150 [Streptomyces tanashiensis]